jgi:hypothetical protein
MMRFKLVRVYEKLGTLGQLFDYNGNRVCWMIERANTGPSPCIYQGLYTLERYNSPAHGPDTWQYPQDQTPGRDHCQIHIANWPWQLLGCQGPGLAPARDAATGAPGVSNSAAALRRFQSLTMGRTQIQIDITS